MIFKFFENYKIRFIETRGRDNSNNKRRMISGEKLREFSNIWGEFRSDITYYLIVAERLKILK